MSNLQFDIHSPYLSFCRLLQMIRILHRDSGSRPDRIISVILIDGRPAELAETDTWWSHASRLIYEYNGNTSEANLLATVGFPLIVVFPFPSIIIGSVYISLPSACVMMATPLVEPYSLAHHFSLVLCGDLNVSGTAPWAYWKSEEETRKRSYRKPPRTKGGRTWSC